MLSVLRYHCRTLTRCWISIWMPFQSPKRGNFNSETLFITFTTICWNWKSFVTHKDSRSRYILLDTRENPALWDSDLSMNANIILYCRSMWILQQSQWISDTASLAEVFRTSSCQSTALGRVRLNHLRWKTGLLHQIFVFHQTRNFDTSFPPHLQAGM